MNQKQMLKWLGNHGYESQFMGLETSSLSEADHHKYLIGCIYGRLKPSEQNRMFKFIEKIILTNKLQTVSKRNKIFNLMIDCGFIVQQNNRYYMDPMAQYHIELHGIQ